MILPILNWLWRAAILVVLTFIAYPLSLFIAPFVTYAEESSITGLPSMYPGKPRAFLIPIFRIWQSPDAPVDEWWYGDYYSNGFLKSGKRTFFGVTIKLWSHGFSTATYEAWYGWPLRWWTRVMWLCRNAAYGFGALLGYDGTGMTFIGSDIEDDTAWNSGKTMSQYWSCTNAKKQFGWCYRAKWWYCSSRCVMIFFGYKLFSDPVRKYVAMGFNPIKTS